VRAATRRPGGGRAGRWGGLGWRGGGWGWKRSGPSRALHWDLPGSRIATSAGVPGGAPSGAPSGGACAPAHSFPNPAAGAAGRAAAAPPPPAAPSHWPRPPPERRPRSCAAPPLVRGARPAGGAPRPAARTGRSRKRRWPPPKAPPARPRAIAPGFQMFRNPTYRDGAAAPRAGAALGGGVRGRCGCGLPRARTPRMTRVGSNRNDQNTAGDQQCSSAPALSGSSNYSAVWTPARASSSVLAGRRTRGRTIQPVSLHAAARSAARAARRRAPAPRRVRRPQRPAPPAARLPAHARRARHRRPQACRRAACRNGTMPSSTAPRAPGARWRRGERRGAGRGRAGRGGAPPNARSAPCGCMPRPAAAGLRADARPRHAPRHAGRTVGCRT
jgi:hypothetical protein